VDEEGQPKLTFFGSAHAHSHDQLAVWVRNPEGGTLRRIAHNPRMSFLYRHPTDRVRWVFEGRAHRVEDGVIRDAIYEAIPALEQAMDAERRGVAVVIDLELVSGRDLEMRR
jgi:hypothetical protein